MTWIAISGEGLDWVSPRRFDTHAARRNVYLTRGSLMFEARPGARGLPQVLLSYQRTHPWSGGLSVQSIPGGGMAVVVSQGDEVFHAVVEPDRKERTDTVRVTFSWDAPGRWARLTVERPEADELRTVELSGSLPVMIEDIYNIVRRPALAPRADDLIYFAFSDEIEPVGPMPSLTAKIPVSTPHGPRCLDQLRRGDTIRTRDAGIVPIVHTVERTVPAFGAFQPVRLRAPYFGLTRDIIVSQQQRLVVGGSEVEYLFGREEVLVPAVSLVNNTAAVFEKGHRVVKYRHLILPGHAALIGAGAPLESLYVGRLARHPDRLSATLLAECPRRFMPEHHRAGYQVLKPFEAITLAEARAA